MKIRTDGNIARASRIISRTRNACGLTSSDYRKVRYYIKKSVQNRLLESKKQAKIRMERIAEKNSSNNSYVQNV